MKALDLNIPGKNKPHIKKLKGKNFFVCFAFGKGATIGTTPNEAYQRFVRVTGGFAKTS